MADSPKEFRAVSGCWRISIKHNEDGTLVAEDFHGQVERSMGYDLPEMVFRNDDPKSKKVVQGTAKSLTAKSCSEHSEDDSGESDNDPPLEQ